MVLNRFPLWKNALIVAVLLLALVYAIPNIFGTDPALQIAGIRGSKVDAAVAAQVNTELATAKIPVKASLLEEHNILLRFADTTQQTKARDLLQQSLGENYVVAMNLAPATPAWLSALNAEPMKLGLDLQGGVHLLIQVDMATAIQNREESYLNDLRNKLREEKIRYVGIMSDKHGGILLKFRDADNANQANAFVSKNFTDLVWTLTPQGQTYVLSGQLSQAAEKEVREYTMDQAVTILRSRVNELGVSEPLVQRQGADRIVVELPGIQNAAEAQDIIGKPATLEFRLVDDEHDATGLTSDRAPIGSDLYRMRDGQPILLKKEVLLSGESIVGATSNFGDQGAEVDVRVGGNIMPFMKATQENVGKHMAVVYIETRFDNRIVDGKTVKVPRVVKEVISAPRIDSALGSSFRVTGMRDMQESRELALLLRAGALSAPVYVAESRTVGPTLGMENIKKGVLSMEVGLALVLVFMALYYGLFGLVADIALLTNLVLLVAVLSWIGTVLTLPGIAGIVLTLGMAVDANVLIFERIREELRNGSTPQASIHAGYEKAFITIVDANVTAFIAALVLFTIGTGAIKGFAIILCIGILTSMFTGITVSRAIVNAIYGGRTIKRLAIGM